MPRCALRCKNSPQPRRILFLHGLFYLDRFCFNQPKSNVAMPTRYFVKNRIRASQLSMAAVFVLYLISASRWEQTVTGSVLFVIGVFLVGIATIGRCWSLLYIVGYKNDTLITVGPYSITRNPLYFFTFIGAIGVAFTTRTFTFVALGAVWFWLFYPGVLRGEEERLAALHGAAFDEYRRRVPRFWPRLGAKFAEPEEYVVSPIPFRKRMVDGLWFVWALGIVELVEALHRVVPGLVILLWY